MTQNTTKKHLWGKLSLLAAAVCVSASAFAADLFPNGGYVQANTDYLIDGADELMATYIPDETGTVEYTWGNGIRTYHDADHQDVFSQTEHRFQSYVNQTYQIDVVKDVPVYFYASKYSMQWDGIRGQIFRISKDEPIKVLSYTEEPGSVLGVTSGYDDMVITFNQPVTASSVTLSIDGTSTEANIGTSTAVNMEFTIPYVATLRNWYNSGTLRGGEGLTFTIKGIKNAAGQEYGQDLILKYTAAAKYTTLLTVDTPTPFMSFWKEGDPKAVMTVTYDGPLSRAEYQLTFGTFESEVPDGYLETGSSNSTDSPAKVTIDGNVLKIDFSNYQRRPQDMVPSGMNYNNLVVKITAWDIDGQPVYASGQGQVGSYEEGLRYQYITPAELNPIFTPANGESLRGQKEIEIHLYDYTKIDFTGVKFEIGDGQNIETIVIPASDITVNPGTNNDWTLVIPVPEAAETATKKVTVTLEGLTSVDGVDHTNDIRAVYNGFTITTFEYYSANGQLITSRALPEFAADSKIQVITNVANEYPNMYMEYEVVRMVKDGDPETVKSASYMIREVDPFDDATVLYTQEFPMSVKLTRNEEYHVIFRAWTDEMSRWNNAEPLGEEYVVFTGTTEPFRFASIDFLGSTPENGTVIEPTQTAFTLEFSGLVNLSKETSYIVYGMGMTVPFEELTPVDSEDGMFANIWDITIPDSYIATYQPAALNMTIVAVDENNLLVEGNEGFEESSYIGLEWTIAGVGENDDYYVTPAEGEVESIQNFEVGCLSQATGLTYDADIAIKLVNRSDRNDSYLFTANDMTIVSVPKEGVEIPDGADEEDTRYYTTVVRFSLPTPITASGYYELAIPRGFFAFGEQFSATVNAPRTIVYEISQGGGEVTGYTVTPAPGEVTELSVITLEFEEGPGLGSGFPTLTINGNEPIVLSEPEVIWPEDWSDLSNKYIQTLPDTYTANGSYVITYPAGFFQNDFGPLAKIELTYIIGTTGINAVFGDAETINAYTLDGRQVISNGNVEDIEALAAGYYVINGKKVVIVK